MHTPTAPTDRPLRLLYTIEAYAPAVACGGAGLYLHDICQYMARRGHEIRILCGEVAEREDYSIRTEMIDKIRVDRVALPHFFTLKEPDGWNGGIRRWRKHMRAIGRLTGEYLSAWQPDLLHYNATRPFGEEFLRVAQRRGVPTIAMLNEGWMLCTRTLLLRSPVAEPGPGPAPARCLKCMYSHYTDQTEARTLLKLPWRLWNLNVFPAYRLWQRHQARQGLTGALGYAKFITEKAVPHIPAPVQYVPLGINLTGLPSERPSRPRSPLRFGFIGGFQPIKGLHHVLDAAAAMKREGLSFELHVWGPGQDEGRSQVTRRGLDDQVLLRGTYGIADLWNVFNEMDVAIMATTECETFGRVPQEAAAVGAPTIAPAVGGITEQIRHDVDGLLYEFRNPLDLERQMWRILTEPGLLPRLIDNLWTVIDTREAAADVERFYYDTLGRTAARAAR